jgi:ABC-2 type transport system permease protein
METRMERIRTIIDKEWAEVFKNRMVIMTIVILPVVFTALPLLVLFFTKPAATGGDMADMPAMFAQTCQNMSMADCMQVYMVNQFLLLYMVMPLAIPIAIAAYSIVGEKTTRSLEPLLATPITTEELLAGKCLAAAIPAIAATWGAFLIFLLLAPFTGISPDVQRHILGPTWLTAVFLVGPLMAVAAVNLAIIVSSRVNDPRAAEQISAVFILPLMGLMFAQIAGLIVINLYLMLVVAVTLLVIDVGLIFIGAELFQREAILTRWK